MIINSKLSMDHLDHLLASCASSIHALRMLRAQGLREQEMHVVDSMTTLASLMYDPRMVGIHHRTRSRKI